MSVTGHFAVDSHCTVSILAQVAPMYTTHYVLSVKYRTNLRRDVDTHVKGSDFDPLKN